MDWINEYDLYLFDFDGLLVNTEELHYLAYKKMLEARGISFQWSFPRYCQSAHYASDQFRKDLFEEFPQLHAYVWDDLYQEKQQNIQEFLKEGAVHLMPGVQALLEALQKKHIRHAVVTHSPDALIQLVRRQHPVLDQIPYWITRHDYTNPKPDPECYLMAIEKYGKAQDRIIGFEDTPRGLTALLGTKAKAVLITGISYPEIPQFLSQGAMHFTSMEHLS